VPEKSLKTTKVFEKRLFVPRVHAGLYFSFCLYSALALLVVSSGL